MLLIKDQFNKIWNVDDIARFYITKKDNEALIKVLRFTGYDYVLAEYPLSKCGKVLDVFNDMIEFLSNNDKGLFEINL